MQEALKQVKAALGPEALILSSRSIRDPQRPRRSLLEIVAAVDHESSREAPRSRAGANPSFSGYSRAGRPPYRPDTPLRERLLASGLAPGWVQPLLQSLESEGERPVDPERLTDTLLQKLTAGVSISPPWSGGRAWALVGPTGAGKTTTLAKLAAHFSIKQAKKVRLITIDTYRIGALDQLRTYARLLGLPLSVATHPEELAPLVENLGAEELALIDTAGSSPHNAGMLRELRDFLTVSPVIGSHLVLSATTKESDLGRIIDRFSGLGLESFVCTKLDETEVLIPLFNQLVPQRRPLSFLTCGQRVPEDLEPATPTRIARLIFSQIQWN
jgi:flagellar biosynthesis protein FlhF